MVEKESATFFIEYLSLQKWFRWVGPVLRVEREKNPQANLVLNIFDASPLGLFLVSVLSRWQGISVRKMNFQITDGLDEQGVSIQFRLLYEDLAELQRSISRDPVFQKFIHEADPAGRLREYLLKSPVCAYDYQGAGRFGQAWHALTLIQVSRWFAAKQGVNDSIVLFLHDRPWMKQLKLYAERSGVSVLSSGTAPKTGSRFKKYARLLTKIKGRTIRALIRYAVKSRIAGTKDQIPFVPYPRMAVEYWGNLNLAKPECHSDLFFLKRSALENRDVLLLFNSMLDPVDETKWQLLNLENISALALSVQASLIDSSFVPVFSQKPKNSRISHFNVNSQENPEIISLSRDADEYLDCKTYWRNLFSQFNIKLTTSWYKYDAQHMAIADALKELGGIATLYQRAYESNPSAATMASTDVLFGFSPQSGLIEQESLSNFSYYVSVGYIGDYRFSFLREKAQGIRSELRKNGARRILAFYDENTLDDGRWFTGHQFTRDNYAFLLNQFLRESDLGLILKPKRPDSLKSRLGPVARLLEEAQATGRCYIYREERSYGSFPPAAAGLGADIAIHEALSAGTAGIESALAGVPTLLLDRDGWPKSPLYKLGKGRIVFTSWPEIWQACLNFWQRPEDFRGILNWSDILNELDPFRDGRAAERLGTYLKWLLEGLKEGHDREEVMANAAARYAKQWGKDKMIEKSASKKAALSLL